MINFSCIFQWQLQLGYSYYHGTLWYKGSRGKLFLLNNQVLRMRSHTLFSLVDWLRVLFVVLFWPTMALLLSELTNQRFHHLQTCSARGNALSRSLVKLQVGWHLHGNSSRSRMLLSIPSGLGSWNAWASDQMSFLARMD